MSDKFGIAEMQRLIEENGDADSELVARRILGKVNNRIDKARSRAETRLNVGAFLKTSAIVVATVAALGGTFWAVKTGVQRTELRECKERISIIEDKRSHVDEHVRMILNSIHGRTSITTKDTE